MSVLKEHLWNWGHLSGSHNKCIGVDSSMSIEGFAKEYGIPNAFVVSYGGNIQPPYDDLAKDLSGLREIKWSVLGDASTPLPDARLGWTQEVIDVAMKQENITGGIVDDFFSEVRLKRFTPEVLKEMRAALNKSPKNLDFWAVLYDSQLSLDLAPYFEAFDGISFWIWQQKDIDNIENLVGKFLQVTEGKRRMLGIYLWDYGGGNKPMELPRFQKHLDFAVELLKAKKIEGIIFCSGCIGDQPLDTNRYLKEYIAKNGDMTI